MLKRTVPLLLVASLIATSLSAADNPFVGKWKLNGAKSRLPDEMKVKRVSANKYAFAFEGGDYEETIVADGRATGKPEVIEHAWQLRTTQRFLLSCSWHTLVGLPEILLLVPKWTVTRLIMTLGIVRIAD